MTPINRETFETWKTKRMAKKKAEWDKKINDFKKGKKGVKISGRAMFQIDSSKFQDDPNATDEVEKEETKSEDDEDVHEIQAPDEEAKLAEQVEAAKVEVNEELFNEEDDDVDLDDLE